MNSHKNKLPPGEQLEAEAMRALHDGANETTRRRLGLELKSINGAWVSMARHDPSILLNRVVGLGLTEPATRDGIDDILAAYRETGVGRFFLHGHPAAQPEDLPTLLTTAGLKPHRRWMKFKRGPQPAPEPQSDLTVRAIKPSEAADFGRIVAPSFDLSPEAAGLFSGLVGQAGFHLYGSFDGKRLAGTGVLYINGQRAWLDWGATDPAFRGRGSQRAVLAQRIRDAIDAGCTELITTTGEAVAGDPQHSYHNIEWAGFRPDYLRDNWVPT